MVLVPSPNSTMSDVDSIRDGLTSGRSTSSRPQRVANHLSVLSVVWMADGADHGGNRVEMEVKYKQIMMGKDVIMT